jgi:hypothetical protein
MVERFTSDPAFPYLISFPRTGSHWLRMIMELYFGTPSLVRIFYYRESGRFTCYHRHDDDLTISRKNVIYLYRHPVDTIYSQMKYYREDPFDAGRVEFWAGLYGRHLHKWLIEETFTTRKTILTYEGLQHDLAAEFAKVCAHFDLPLDRERLIAAARTVTREEVHKRTRHDPQVVDLTLQYGKVKENFVATYSGKIMSMILAVHPGVTGRFAPSRERRPPC